MWQQVGVAPRSRLSQDASEAPQISASGIRLGRVGCWTTYATSPSSNGPSGAGQRSAYSGHEPHEWLNLAGKRPLDLGMSEKTFEGLLLDELDRRQEEGLTNQQIREWSRYDRRQTTRILAELVQRGVIAWSGKRGRGARYWHPHHVPSGR